jgi:hypothetical protein
MSNLTNPFMFINYVWLILNFIFFEINIIYGSISTIFWIGALIMISEADKNLNSSSAR